MAPLCSNQAAPSVAGWCSCWWTGWSPPPPRPRRRSGQRSSPTLDPQLKRGKQNFYIVLSYVNQFNWSIFHKDIMSFEYYSQKFIYDISSSSWNLNLKPALGWWTMTYLLYSPIYEAELGATDTFNAYSVCPNWNLIFHGFTHLGYSLLYVYRLYMHTYKAHTGVYISV